MEDPRLGSFLDRLASEEASDVEKLSFKLILSNFKHFFLKEFEIVPPYNDQVQKRYNGFIQLHWPYEKADCKSGLCRQNLALDMGAFPMFEDSKTVLQFLSDNCVDAAQTLAQDVKNVGIKEFFQLELPKGCMGALWNAPIRLVWDYYIGNDCVIARFDIIGRVG